MALPEVSMRHAFSPSLCSSELELQTLSTETLNVHIIFQAGSASRAVVAQKGSVYIAFNSNNPILCASLRFPENIWIPGHLGPT